MIQLNWTQQSCCGNHRQARVDVGNGREVIAQGCDEDGYIVMVTVDNVLDVGAANGGITRGVRAADLESTVEAIAQPYLGK